MKPSIFYINKNTGQAYCVSVHNIDDSEVCLSWNGVRDVWISTFDLDEFYIKVNRV